MNNKEERYQDVIVEYLQEYAKIKPVNQPDVDSQVIADRENNHFQLLRVGWQDGRYVFTVVFHFDIKDGKVWFQRNITERDVVDEFMEKGIPASDIVLGFRPPEMRPFTGYGIN